MTSIQRAFILCLVRPTTNAIVSSACVRPCPSLLRPSPRRKWELQEVPAGVCKKIFFNTSVLTSVVVTLPREVLAENASHIAG